MAHKLPFLRRLKIRLDNFRFKRSGLSFEDYYVAQTSRIMGKGVAHPTLGTTGGGKHIQPEQFREAGQSTFNMLVRRGLKPSDVLVDYGCGSLRVGQHLIGFLDPACYWGMDITDRFFNEGLAEMEPGQVEHKAPRLKVINDENLAEAAAAKPDWVVSFGVIQHVAPSELGLFMRKLLVPAHAGTQVLVKARLATATTQLAWATWIHSRADIEQAVQQAGAEVTLEVVREKVLDEVGPVEATNILLQKS